MHNRSAKVEYNFTPVQVLWRFYVFFHGKRLVLHVFQLQVCSGHFSFNFIIINIALYYIFFYNLMRLFLKNLYNIRFPVVILSSRLKIIARDYRFFNGHLQTVSFLSYSIYTYLYTYTSLYSNIALVEECVKRQRLYNSLSLSLCGEPPSNCPVSNRE